jgi:RNA polymerase sigma-70 factor (ECF subfamily)
LDRDEFTRLYAASFQRLVGQLYALTGDQAEAQDAVQEAFALAWARHSKIGGEQAPEAWVRVAAWRIAASRWRRARNGARLMLLTARPESTAGPDPDRVALVDALRKVPAEQRRALVLYHLCDLTVDQIAAETVRAQGRSRPGWRAAGPRSGPCRACHLPLPLFSRIRPRRATSCSPNPTVVRTTPTICRGRPGGTPRS